MYWYELQVVGEKVAIGIFGYDLGELRELWQHR